MANPSGLLNAAVSMLAHIGDAATADKVKNAWLTTIVEGYHTADIYKEGQSVKKDGTQEFAEEVINRLGKEPSMLNKSKLIEGAGTITLPTYERKNQIKTLVGVDVFIDWKGSNPDELGAKLSELGAFKMQLKMITNRGVKVFPNGLKETYCTDHWRCRFVASEALKQADKVVYLPIEYEQLLALLSKLHEQEFDVIKTENLYEFDGKRGFSLGQGE